MSKQRFGSVFSAEMKRVVFKPKRLLVVVIFTVVTILVFIGMSAAVDWSVSVAAEQGIPLDEAPPAFLGFATPLSFLSFCLGIYAASFSARDFNDGTIMATLLAVPNRTRLFFARMLPWVVLSIIVSLIAFGVIGVIGIGKAGADQTTFIAIQGILAVISAAFTTIIGFCCGNITKKGSLSVLLFLALFFLLPAVLGMAGGFGPDFLQEVVKWINIALPGNSFAAILNIYPLDQAVFETWASLGISIAWVAGGSILSLALFKIRGTLGR